MKIIKAFFYGLVAVGIGALYDFIVTPQILSDFKMASVVLFFIASFAIFLLFIKIILLFWEDDNIK